jgi:hypothetical protein
MMKHPRFIKGQIKLEMAMSFKGFRECIALSNSSSRSPILTFDLSSFALLSLLLSATLSPLPTKYSGSLRTTAVLDLMTLPWFLGECRGYSLMYEGIENSPFGHGRAGGIAYIVFS